MFSIESKYQYLLIKTVLFSSLCRQRNLSIVISIRLDSISDSGLSVPDTQSPNSSREVIAIGFLFAAEMYSYFFNARFLG